VLLTTHRMDEADVLCSRIAILAAGRLRCIGPQQVCIFSLFSRISLISGNDVGVQMLKTRYGDGYVIRVNFVPERQAEVERFVRCGQSSKAK
jgi:ABC-type multidrug transport system ATPase subunit